MQRGYRSLSPFARFSSFSQDFFTSQPFNLVTIQHFSRRIMIKCCREYNFPRRHFFLLTPEESVIYWLATDRPLTNSPSIFLSSSILCEILIKMMRKPFYKCLDFILSLPSPPHSELRLVPKLSRLLVHYFITFPILQTFSASQSMKSIQE